MKPSYYDACTAAIAAAEARDAACEAYEHAHRYGSVSQVDAAHIARDAAERAFWRAVEARDAARDAR